MTIWERDIKPDYNMANQFLRIMFGDDGQTIFQVFKNAGHYTGTGTWKKGSLGEKRIRDWLEREQKAGAGVYFVVNETDGDGRSRENIIRVRALFVDLDGAPTEPLFKVPVKPHVIIESSEGRYQAFWKVVDCPLDKFSAAQKALIKRFGGDPLVFDLPRVMRLPGFWHLKGQAFQSHIFDSNPRRPSFDFDDIVNGLQLVLDEPKLVDPDIEPGTCQTFPQGTRHHAMITMTSRLRNANFEGKDLYEALQKQNLKCCKPPLPDSEIRAMARWGNGKSGRAIEPIFSEAPKTTPPKRLSGIMTWSALRNETLPDVQWIIPDLLPEGLTILAGMPKVGKSWLGQSICLAVAANEKALDRFPVNRGATLNLALEDNPRRFRSRMDLMTGGARVPESAQFACDWPRLPEAVNQLRLWLDQQQNPKLIVIDTLAKIRPDSLRRSDSVYDRDYSDIGMLQMLASEYSIAIVLIHHKRKAAVDDPVNSISGSAGITGAADTMWILDRRSRDEMSGWLRVGGRDISDRRLPLKWDSTHGLWIFDEHESASAVESGKEIVMEALRMAGVPMTPSEIGDKIGRSRSRVGNLLSALVKDGKVEKSLAPGRYVLVPEKGPFDYPQSWEDPFGEEESE